MEPLKKFAYCYYFLIITNLIFGGKMAFETKNVILAVSLLFFNTLFIIGTILFTLKKNMIGFYMIVGLFIFGIISLILTFRLFNIIPITFISVFLWDIIFNGKKFIDSESQM
jgi:hypothetical protein